MDQAPEADDGSILFWRGADEGPEPLFEWVLAKMQRRGEIVDADDAAMLPDQLDGVADEQIVSCIGEVTKQEGFDEVYPILIVTGFGQPLQQFVELAGAKEVIGRNALAEQFIRGHPGKGGDAPFFEEDHEVGGISGVDKMPDRFAETGDGDIRQGFHCLRFLFLHSSLIAKRQHQRCIGDHHTVEGFIRLDEDELPHIGL